MTGYLGLTMVNNSGLFLGIGAGEILVILFLLTAIIVPVVLIAAARMREFQSRSLAIAGSVLIMLPFSLIAIPGIPVGIWLLRVLMRDDVRRAFAEKTVSIETTRAQIQKAGMWLFISGILATLIFGAIAAFCVAQMLLVPASENNATVISLAAKGSILIFLSLALLQLVASIKMKNLASIHWSYLAAIIGLIPFSPFWLVSFPSSIYALAVLGQQTDGVKNNSGLFGPR